MNNYFKRITLFWLKAMCLRGTVLTPEELVWYAKRPEFNDRAYRVAEDEFATILKCALKEVWGYTIVFDATTGQEVSVQLQGNGRPLEERVATFLRIKVR